MKKKRVIILGSTGSVGKSAIAVVRHHEDILEIAALSAHTNEELLLEQQAEFGVPVLALSGRKPLSESIAYSGPEGLVRMIEETEADVVLNGINGSEGLIPSCASLRTGKDLALANKETVVMAGKVVKDLAKRKKRLIIPVDSEHSAVFNLLRNTDCTHLAEIILTASGGAFRSLPMRELPYVTVKQALVHPTWSMGEKITIDSATMANKGLEVLEAAYLFDVPAERIKVVIHPQSLVHSMIRTREGSIYAQISMPDMRIPIQNAFTYPDVVNSVIDPFDLIGKKLEFYRPDMRRYKMLKLGYDALKSGGSCPIVYNAANEVAVAGFIKEKLGFMDIADLVEETLLRDWSEVYDSVEGVMEIHREAADTADRILRSKSGKSVVVP